MALLQADEAETVEGRQGGVLGDEGQVGVIAESNIEISDQFQYLQFSGVGYGRLQRPNSFFAQAARRVGHFVTHALRPGQRFEHVGADPVHAGGLVPPAPKAALVAVFLQAGDQAVHFFFLVKCLPPEAGDLLFGQEGHKARGHLLVAFVLVAHQTGNVLFHHVEQVGPGVKRHFAQAVGQTDRHRRVAVEHEKLPRHPFQPLRKYHNLPQLPVEIPVFPLYGILHGQ